MKNPVLNRNDSYRNITYRTINDTMLYRFMCLFLVIFALIPFAGATVTDLQISPENPVVGDTITICGTESAASEINAIASFTKVVTPIGGLYEYTVGSVEIPDGSKNFAVTAVGVKDLYVKVKLYGCKLPLTIGKDGSSGTATISQSNVPTGTHNIKILGLAETGVSSVSLKVSATQGIDVGPDGHFEYRYSTGSIPIGDFNINVGGSTKTITLRASSGNTDVGADTSGGGGGASEEQADNIVAKETSAIKVYANTLAICEFYGPENPLMFINFTSTKSVGSVPMLVEVLYDTSILAKEPAPGVVYKNINILIGFAGFDGNIANATISFKVDKDWIDNNNIDKQSITLMHYDDSSDVWEQVVTEWIGENEGEVYYQTFTSKFSPFAIVGKENIDLALSDEPMRITPKTTDTMSDQVAGKGVISTTYNVISGKVWIGLFSVIALWGIFRIRRIF